MQKQRKIQQKLLKVLFSFFMWPSFLASYDYLEIYASSIFCYSIASVSNFCVLTLVISTSKKEQEHRDTLWHSFDSAIFKELGLELAATN